MNNYRFIGKCIIALLFCIIGLLSCGNDNNIPTNEIHYTTIDNNVLPIEDLFYFGAGRIVSNSYDPDKNVCILKLDKDVTEIGDRAFSRCSSLTSISIPESVTEIGEGAFSHCSNLTFITLPESLTEIGKMVFYNCRLKSISIPPSVTKIGEIAFSGCSSLKSIIISKDNKVYDSREDCNAIIHTESNTLIRGCKNTIIPASVTKIEDLAFEGCSSLTSITIPESVTKIGDGAFLDCSSLTSISIPPSVTKIGKGAFYGCSSLTSISIPPTVTEIGFRAFCNCSSLTEVRIPKGCNVDEDAFKNCPNVQIIRY